MGCVDKSLHAEQEIPLTLSLLLVEINTKTKDITTYLLEKGGKETCEMGLFHNI